MLIVVVLAVLVCWWLSDEPSKAAPPAPAATQQQPAAPPPAESVYQVGGGQLPAGEQLDGVAHFHRAHRLVPPPPIPCKDRGPA